MTETGWIFSSSDVLPRLSFYGKLLEQLNVASLSRPIVFMQCCSLKVKDIDIYIPPLTLNDQQRFTIPSGVLLTSNDTRWRSASSGSPLPE